MYHPKLRNKKLEWFSMEKTSSLRHVHLRDKQSHGYVSFLDMTQIFSNLSQLKVAAIAWIQCLACLTLFVRMQYALSNQWRACFPQLRLYGNISKS